MKTLFLVTDCQLLIMSSCSGCGEEALTGLFYKGTNAIHESSTLMTNHLLKALPPKSLGVRFQYMI